MIFQNGSFTAAETESASGTVVITDSPGSTASASVTVKVSAEAFRRFSGGCSSTAPVSMPFAGLLALVGAAAVLWLRRRPRHA